MKRILIIDDEKDIQLLFRAFLRDAGYEVDMAGDGAIGYKLHEENPYDLVILDIFMPNQDGIETISKLRMAGTLPLIVAISGGSGWNASESLYIAQKLGATLTLQKPVERALLINSVNELLADSLAI